MSRYRNMPPMRLGILLMRHVEAIRNIIAARDEFPNRAEYRRAIRRHVIGLKRMHSAIERSFWA